MKRSVDDILRSIKPFKSQKAYEKAYTEFKKYIGKEEKPDEHDFIQYFDHLKNTKGFASSSIWSHYSMLNNMHQTLYGEKLQKYPRITHILKSYEAGYVRKSSLFFTKQQIMEFLKNAPNTGEFIHIKAAVVIGYCGGLRCADMVGLKTEDCTFDETSGMWIDYNVSKQRGEAIRNKFNVPLEYCGFLEAYDHELFRCQANEGRLFKTYRIRNDGTAYYTKQPMGIHFLSKINSKVANFLKLPNPERYTGHCFRRSSANALAEAGCSTTALKKHFNWQNEATALRYVENTKNAKLAISDKIASSSSSMTTMVSGLQTEERSETKVLNLTNCQNIVINF